MIDVIATVINSLLILVGSLAGLFFRNKIKQTYLDAIVMGIGLCVMVVGIDSALSSNDTLCVIICMALGIIIGELLRIEDRLNQLGDVLKAKFSKKDANSRFTEGFMAATLLFAIGSMAILGSIEAGINHDYSIILSKSVMDCLMAIGFAATMGIGVAFSAIPIFLYQGGLTLLAGVVAPYLSDALIAEMSGVGGVIIIGLSINILGLMGDRHLRTGNMLPAIFLPVLYLPIAEWLGGIL